MGFSAASPESMYGPLPDEKYPIEGLDVSTLDPSLFRQEVDFPSKYRPGTIVVNIPERRLFLVQPDGKALRYAVGVGRSALSQAGENDSTCWATKAVSWPIISSLLL